MRTLDYLHLNESAVANVVNGLNQLLADYQVFYQNLRGFHWNIKGHGFFVLHGKFEDMYNDVANKVDEIAERMLVLPGYFGRCGNVARIHHDVPQTLPQAGTFLRRTGRLYRL